VPAEPSFERSFQADHEVLQREQKDVVGWLTVVAYLVVAFIAFALLVMIAWALHRLAVVVEEPSEQEQEAPATSTERTKIGPEVTA
jgi:flagellar biosynthesis/type III secretory pathway M-ring protein FliF/YscJ